MDHGFKHLRSYDHRLGGGPAFAHHALLQRRHVLYRQFHAKIATRHHDSINLGQDGVEIGHGGGLFDLDHDGGTAFDQFARLDHVLGALHEAEREPVDTKFAGKFQVHAVFFGERGQRQHHVRHVHALAVGDDTAGDDLCFGEIRAAFQHPQPDVAVIDQQARAGFKCRKNLGVGQVHAVDGAGRFVQIEPKPCAVLQVLFAIGKGADAQFRPLKVGKDGDGAAHLFFDLADDPVLVADTCMIPVAHVEAEHIRAGLVQGQNGLVRFRGRSQRGHDLDVAMASHLCPFVLYFDVPRAGHRLR